MKREEIRESGESTISQRALVDDRGLGFNCGARLDQSFGNIVLRNLYQLRGRQLEFVQHNAFMLVTSLSDEYFILRLFVRLHRTGIFQVVAIHPRRERRGEIADEVSRGENQLAVALFHFSTHWV